MSTGKSGLYKNTKGAKESKKAEEEVKVKETKTRVKKAIKEEAIQEETKKPVKEVKPAKETKKADVKEEFCEGIELEGELLQLFLTIDTFNSNLDATMSLAKSNIKGLISNLVKSRNDAVTLMDKINHKAEDTRKKLEGPIDDFGVNILHMSNMIIALRGVNDIISSVEGSVKSGNFEINGD